MSDELDPDAFGPSLPLIEPCGCSLDEGHRCRPPWLTEDEWKAMP